MSIREDVIEAIRRGYHNPAAIAAFLQAPSSSVHTGIQTGMRRGEIHRASHGHYELADQPYTDRLIVKLFSDQDLADIQRVIHDWLEIQGAMSDVGDRVAAIRDRLANR